jgi:hypothetical protein
MQSPAPTDWESQTSLMLSGFSSVSLTCPLCVFHIIPYAWSVQFQSSMHFPSLTIPRLDDAEQIETDIVSARETGSSSRSWTKSQRVKHVPVPQFFELRLCIVDRAHEYIHRLSTAR